MKVLISLSIKWTDPVLKWIVLYFTFVTVEVSARCYDEEGRCWRNALDVKHTLTVERDEREVNPCEWSGNDCKIQCYLDSSIYNASEKIQSIYEDVRLIIEVYQIKDFDFCLFCFQREECHFSGVSLNLHSLGINNLTANWFTANINLKELEMDLYNIYRIEDSPFKAEVFSTVETLTLKSLCPCELQKITFMGLQSLKTLKIRNILFDDISDIEIGVLELVNETLTTFELIEQNNQDKEISISNFIGDNSAALISIENVKFRYKLSSINHLSFTAISNVKVLDLSDCQITNIGDFTFNSLGESLQLLNLERNMLVTLPEGIFTHLNLSPMSEEPFLKILLNENPWDCDTGVEHLRQLLVDYSNFDSADLCDMSDMCPHLILPDPTIPTTTTTTPTTTHPPTDPTTTTTSTSTTTEDITGENTNPTNGTTEFFGDLTGKQCISSDDYDANVFIQRQICEINVTVKSNEVSVFINSNEPNLALIWFGSNKLTEFPDSYHQGHIIDCVSASQNEIKLRNLKQEIAYTVCLINIDVATVSPLDCISFYQYGSENNGVWLLQSSKQLVIKVNVGGLLVTIVFGIVIGSIFSFRMTMHSSKNNTVFLQESDNPNAASDSK